MIELTEEFLKLAAIVTFLYVALVAYAGWRRPAWADAVAKRRFQILLMLVLAAVAIKVAAIVVNGESGDFDERLLRFIHAHVPASLDGFFQAVTVTGSVKTILPLLAIVVVALLMAKRRFEALLLSFSLASSFGLGYILKTMIGRARPALWDTEWYWGSSFPSGHTLTTAAVATAAALCAGRIWTGRRHLAILVAMVWTGAVGLSRMVLGVHWPTDVLAAMCLGALLPLAMVTVHGARRCATDASVVAPAGTMHPRHFEGATMHRRALMAGLISLLVVSAAIWALHAVGKAEVGGVLGIGPLIADINLGLELLLVLGLTWGMFLARSGNIEAHRINQTIWVLVNGALVLFIMVSAMASFKIPNLKALTDVGNAITVLHAIFGVLTVAAGTWLVLQMNDVLPARWHVPWWKGLMRFTLAGYWVVALLGIATYYYWYAA
ncbi:MAG: phosphatase PAP2 family protein [Casimicrobiaceae bacterium]